MRVTVAAVGWVGVGGLRKMVIAEASPCTAVSGVVKGSPDFV